MWDKREKEIEEIRRTFGLNLQQIKAIHAIGRRTKSAKMSDFELHTLQFLIHGGFIMSRPGRGLKLMLTEHGQRVYRILHPYGRV